MSTPPLFRHQADSVRFFENLNVGADFSSPGTGKTRTQIELFHQDAIRGGKDALVIAPRSLLVTAWEDDFKSFAPGVKISVAWAKNRAEAFNRPSNVCITNTDAVRWLAEQPRNFFRRFDRLIIDESTSFKSPDSKRTQALFKIRKYFDKRFILSGGPNPNSVTELWAQIFALDDGSRLGSSFYAFRNNVTTSVQVGPSPYAKKYTDREGIEEVVGELIRDISIRHRLEECLDIPKNQVLVYRYHPNPQVVKQYKRMEEYAIMMTQDHQVVTAVNAAVLLNKLLQVASGAVYSEGGKYALISKERYELIADLIEERQNSVVFYYWKHQRDELIKEFKKRKISHVVVDGDTSDQHRVDAVRLFQGGLYKVFLCHPKTGAHGLTLTRGTTTVFPGPTFDLEWWTQGMRRIYRAGQTQKTQTLVVVGDNTIEQKVLDRLMNKHTRQESLLDLIYELGGA